MKKILALFLSITIILALDACNSDRKPIDTIENTSDDNNSSSATDMQSQPDILIDTEYYTIAVPSSWDDDCFYKVADGENYNYTLSFYDKASHEETNGGRLFSIKLLTEFEDYSNYPDYDILGSLEVYRIGSYNIVVTYPTDVQCSDKTAEKYREMSSEISDILNTISFKDECTYSEDPIPVENSTAIQESLSIDFYAELCTYVVSSCVNYTEWWNSSTLSYTDPTHYYLGNITAENYAEKMDKAKQLVDGVYKAGYWEIRYRGYGTMLIGLYITPEDELYFCYKYCRHCCEFNKTVLC